MEVESGAKTALPRTEHHGEPAVRKLVYSYAKRPNLAGAICAVCTTAQKHAFPSRVRGNGSPRMTRL